MALSPQTYMALFRCLSLEDRPCPDQPGARTSGALPTRVPSPSSVSSCTITTCNANETMCKTTLYSLETGQRGGRPGRRAQARLSVTRLSPGLCAEGGLP